MVHLLGPVLLLLIPFFLVLTFAVWVLSNFSRELRQGRRRRIVSSALYGRAVKIYMPERQVLRFRRRRDHEAA